MVYLNCENPVVETTIDRNICIGDILYSDKNKIFELINISEVLFEDSAKMVVLQDISKRNNFTILPLNTVINDLKDTNSKTNFFYKFEKVSNVLNSRWKGEY